MSSKIPQQNFTFFLPQNRKDKFCVLVFKHKAAMANRKLFCLSSLCLFFALFGLMLMQLILKSKILQGKYCCCISFIRVPLQNWLKLFPRLKLKLYQASWETEKIRRTVTQAEKVFELELGADSAFYILSQKSSVQHFISFFSGVSGPWLIGFDVQEGIDVPIYVISATTKHLDACCLSLFKSCQISAFLVGNDGPTAMDSR